MKSHYSFRKISMTLFMLIFVTGFGSGTFDAAKSKPTAANCRPANITTKQ